MKIKTQSGTVYEIVDDTVTRWSELPVVDRHTGRADTIPQPLGVLLCTWHSIPWVGHPFRFTVMVGGEQLTYTSTPVVEIMEEATC